MPEQNQQQESIPLDPQLSYDKSGKCLTEERDSQRMDIVLHRAIQL